MRCSATASRSPLHARPLSMATVSHWCWQAVADKSKDMFRRHSRLYAWIVAGITSAFFLVVGRIFFDSNDDAGLVEIVSGARSVEWQTHMIYSNILLGHILIFLYDSWHGINWFVVLQCLISIFCLVCINGFILNRSRSCKSWMTVVLCFLVSCVLLYQYVRNVKHIKSTTVAVCIAIILCLGSRAIDRHAYNSTEWQNFLHLSSMRQTIQDNLVETIDADKETFGLIAGSENNLKVIRNWLVGDEAVLDESRLKSIIVAANDRRSPLSSLPVLIDLSFSAVKTIFGILFCSRLGWTILVFIAIALNKCIYQHYSLSLHFVDSHKVLFALILALLAYGLLLHGYLLYYLNRCIFRAYYGYWLFLLLVILPSATDALVLARKSNFLCHKAFLIIALCLMLPSLGQSAIQTLRYHRKFNPMLAKYRQMLEMCNHDSDSIYIFTNSYTAAHNAYHPLLTPRVVPAENCLFLNGWDVPSPRAMAHRRRIGMEHPFQELANCRNDIYLMGDYCDVVVAYLNEHYGNDFSLQKANEYAGFPVWRVIRVSNAKHD